MSKLLGVFNYVEDIIRTDTSVPIDIMNLKPKPAFFFKTHLDKLLYGLNIFIHCTDLSKVKCLHNFVYDGTWELYSQILSDLFTGYLDIFEPQLVRNVIIAYLFVDFSESWIFSVYLLELLRELGCKSLVEGFSTSCL